MATNKRPKKQRLSNSEAFSEKFQKTLDSIDKTKLADFINVKGKITFENLFSTQKDLEGSDFQLLVNGSKHMLVSLKQREDNRSDLGIEIVRFYEYLRRRPDGDHELIISGGRDLFVPLIINAHFDEERNFAIADRLKRTVSDMYLLTTEHRNIFIRYDAVKELSEYYMEKCFKKLSEISQHCTDDFKRKFSDLSSTLSNLMNQNKKDAINGFLGNPEGLDFWVVVDSDTKEVTYNGETKNCRIGKIIMYVNFEKYKNWIEGKDYICV